MAKIYLHQEIERDILGKIHRGEYAEGDRIPASKELSQQFGTSTVTVDRALTRLVERGYISRTARKGTFVTDRSMWTKDIGDNPHKLVSLFMHQSPSAYFWNDAVQGIHDGLNDKGYQMLVNQTTGDPKMTESYLRSVSSRGIEAVLFVPLAMASREEYVETNLALAATIKESGVPCILFNRHLPGSGLSSAASDDYPAAKWLTDRLMEQKPSHPILITHSFISSFTEREAAFTDVLAKHGFNDGEQRIFRLSHENPRGSMAHRLEIQKILDENKECDGVFCVCTDILFLVLEEINRCDPINRRKIDVVNFDDIGHGPPPQVIASAIPSAYKLGYLAADLVVLKAGSWKEPLVELFQPCVLTDHRDNNRVKGESR